MILILVVALFGLGDCTGGGAVGGIYGDLLDNLKNVGGYENQQYGRQKEYINVYKDDNKDKEYDSKKDNDDYKQDGGENQEQYRGYDDGQKYENQKDYNGYELNGNKDGYDDKKNDRWNQGYGYNDDRKFDKYDGPKDYVVSDKYRDDYRSGRLGSDIREYDYMGKCDIKEKDCKDGKDCYDKAKARSEYDKCRDQYGNEDRYYDESDRFTGDRYRNDNNRNRYSYEKDCYDNSKDRDEYNKCLDRNDNNRFSYEKDCYDKSKDRSDYDRCLDGYDNKRNRYDYDKDCYDKTKDRNDYNKCRQYYRRCRDNYYSRGDYRYFYREDDWKNDRDCYDSVNLVGLGRNDREDQLIRPCALDDRQCIRKYLARNSKCKPAYGPISDPLYLKRSTIYYPFVNITVIRTRLRVTGLSSIKISEFYVNKDTKNLVIALDFTNMNQTTPRAYFRYKRTAKESIVLSDYSTIEYKSGTFTAVIPKIPHLRLELAEVHADIDDLLPPYFIGPKAFASTDPDVITGFAKLNSDVPTATQEGFLFQSQLYTAIYIQENLCDFGLKIISV